MKWFAYTALALASCGPVPESFTTRICDGRILTVTEGVESDGAPFRATVLHDPGRPGGTITFYDKNPPSLEDSVRGTLHEWAVREQEGSSERYFGLETLELQGTYEKAVREHLYGCGGRV